MAADLAPPSFTATIVMADAAQVADGRLSMLGGGLGVLAATPQPVSVALLVGVPWHRSSDELDWTLELLDADGLPVIIGEVPVVVSGQLRAGPPPGWPEGAPITVPIAINFSAIPLPPGERYCWRLAIDGHTKEGWQSGFSVAPAPLQQA